MTIEDLKIKLENDKELNIYLKGLNNLSDNTTCIINENNKWEVFHYERGVKINLKIFNNETDACEYFEKLILEKRNRNRNKIKQVIEQYKKLTEKECYSISCIEGKPSIMDNKIGGNPYLPVGIEYPKDKNGNPMALLIQLNLKDINLPNYPNKGILEVFLNKDFDYPTQYIIKYFEDGLEYQTEFPNVNLNNFILNEPIKIEAKKEISHMPLNDYRSKQNIYNSIQKVYGGGLAIDTKWYFKNYIDCYDNWYNEMENSLNIPKANVGGYADFTQQDPRFGENEKRTECLLKIDSYLDKKINIGDAGIIFILIDPNDIKDCTFENATLDWDCC